MADCTEAVATSSEEQATSQTSTELSDQLAGALQLVGAQLDAWDRCQARLANRLLARALDAAVLRLSVPVLAFERGLPESAASLAASAPAATEAVLHVKAEQAWQEDTFPLLFEALAAKGQLHSLTIKEYSCSPPSNTAPSSSADHWAPHLHVFAPRLTLLHVQLAPTSAPLQPVHLRLLRQLTSLRSLQLLEHPDWLGGPFPSDSAYHKRPTGHLAARLAAASALTGLTDLLLKGCTAEQVLGGVSGCVAVYKGIEKLLASCTHLRRLDMSLVPQNGNAVFVEPWAIPPSMLQLVLGNGLCLGVDDVSEAAGYGSESEEERGGRDALEQEQEQEKEEEYGQHQLPASGLRSLSLRDHGLTEDSWHEVFAIDHVNRNLTELIEDSGSLGRMLQEELERPGAWAPGRSADEQREQWMLPQLRSLRLQVMEQRGIEALTQLPRLRRLELSWRVMGAEYDDFQVQRAELGVLSGLHALTRLRVDGITPQGLLLSSHEVTQLAQGLTGLKELEFRGPVGSWNRHVRLPGSLTSLVLHHRVPTSQPAPTSAKYYKVLLDAATLRTSLVHLELFTGWHSDGESGFVNALSIGGVPHLPCLRSLALHPDGRDKLQDTLKGCPGLRELKLACALPHTTLDVQLLPALLPHLTSLKILELAHSQHTASTGGGACAILHLKSIGLLATTLRSLTLSMLGSYTLNRDEIAALGALSHLTALRQYSHVRHGDWPFAVRVLLQLRSLQFLSLSRDDLPVDALMMLERGLPIVEALEPHLCMGQGLL